MYIKTAALPPEPFSLRNLVLAGVWTRDLRIMELKYEGYYHQTTTPRLIFIFLQIELTMQLQTNCMVVHSVFYMCFWATVQLQINCTVAAGTFTGLIVWQIMYQSMCNNMTFNEICNKMCNKMCVIRCVIICVIRCVIRCTIRWLIKCKYIIVPCQRLEWLKRTWKLWQCQPVSLKDWFVLPLHR